VINLVIVKYGINKLTITLYMDVGTGFFMVYMVYALVLPPGAHLRTPLDLKGFHGTYHVYHEKPQRIGPCSASNP